MKTALKKNSYV